jgi:hypothetical protein
MNPMLMQMLQQYYAQQQGGRGMGMGQFRSLGQMANPYMGMGMGGGYGGPGMGYGGPQGGWAGGMGAPRGAMGQAAQNMAGQMNAMAGSQDFGTPVDLNAIGAIGGPAPPPDMTDNSGSLAAARAAFGGPAAAVPGQPGLYGGGAMQGGMPRMAMGPGLMAGRRRGWY